MDYKERFRNILKRLKSSSNRERYNAICTLTQNDDEQRVWAICRKFWGNNKEPLDMNFRKTIIRIIFRHSRDGYLLESMRMRASAAHLWNTEKGCSS